MNLSRMGHSVSAGRGDAGCSASLSRSWQDARIKCVDLGVAKQKSWSNVSLPVAMAFEYSFVKNLEKWHVCFR